MAEKQAAGHMTMDEKNAELVITRTFHAPRELVFKVWTQAEHLSHWWGPKGFELNVARLDLRPGGVFHYSMKSADGFEMWGKFVYEEITAPEKIVFVNSFADPEGNTIRSPFSDIWPLEVRNTLTLTESEGTTTLTLRGGPLRASEEERRAFVEGFESMKQGFGGTFDQLEAYLANA